MIAYLPQIVLVVLGAVSFVVASSVRQDAFGRIHFLEFLRPYTFPLELGGFVLALIGIFWGIFTLLFGG
jgi:hypothetical protein